MTRASTLLPPFEDLAKRAGSVNDLRFVMGGVPQTTLSRWNQQIRDGEELPRSAKLAISLAENKLKEQGK